MNVEELIAELNKAAPDWPVRLWAEGTQYTVRDVRIDVERQIVLLAKREVSSDE